MWLKKLFKKERHRAKPEMHMGTLLTAHNTRIPQALITPSLVNVYTTQAHTHLSTRTTTMHNTGWGGEPDALTLLTTLHLHLCL